MDDKKDEEGQIIKGIPFRLRRIVANVIRLLLDRGSDQVPGFAPEIKEYFIAVNSY